jgi:uncharacterized membrane protein YraQ (UPF0718 family)
VIWAREWRWLALLAGGFAVVFFLPVGVPRFDVAVLESLYLVKWYAREHVLLCLIPALFIAGAVSVFIRQEAVTRYLGAGANRVLAYGVASVSGTILAVCSCTVLPLFAGIHRRGAGIGPASAFLYAGPAINVLAIILTARVLGMELGIARAVGAVLFSIAIGLAMHGVFGRDERAAAAETAIRAPQEPPHSLGRETVYFASMIGILVFANWPQHASGLWEAIASLKWTITALLGVTLAGILVGWLGAPWWKVALVTGATAGAAVAAPDAPLVGFTVAIVGLAAVTSTDGGQAGDWFAATWEFTKQIVPLLLLGVMLAGLLLGRPGHEGLIPSRWITDAVGGNSLRANLLAAVAGAFMYFATLTEIPILQGLMGSGMGKGPALALLLAGPALSLPSMLVLRKLIGLRKTVVFAGLVVIAATMSGALYGSLG